MPFKSVPPKRKLLVIPSWYPRPDDKINGSFFQEQAKLVSDQFDVKVLLCRFVSRPSIRGLKRTPLKTGREWARFISRGKYRVQLPDEEVFTNPPLIEYRQRIVSLTQRSRYRKSLEAYLEAFGELISGGWKPDIIHAHSVNLAGLVAHSIKVVYGIPYVITEHMPFALCNYPACMRKDIRQAFLEADVALSLGYDMVRQLGMNDIDIEANLIHNLVDDEMFSRLCAAYRPGNPLRLISIGGAVHYKDQRTLLRALLELRRRKIPFTLTLIGLKAYGGLYDETIEFIKNNDLESSVAVIDLIERNEVCGFLVNHDVFVMTSIFETFCVSIIEALACGLPVITTNHGGGSVDLISDDTGFVVPVRDYLGVAEALESIYLGMACFEPRLVRHRVVSICGTNAFKQRLTTYYERAMNKAA